MWDTAAPCQHRVPTLPLTLCQPHVESPGRRARGSCCAPRGPSSTRSARAAGQGCCSTARCPLARAGAGRGLLPLPWPLKTQILHLTYPRTYSRVWVLGSPRPLTRGVGCLCSHRLRPGPPHTVHGGAVGLGAHLDVVPHPRPQVLENHPGVGQHQVLQERHGALGGCCGPRAPSPCTYLPCLRGDCGSPGRGCVGAAAQRGAGIPGVLLAGVPRHAVGAHGAVAHLVEEEVWVVREWCLPRHVDLPRGSGPAGTDVHRGADETCRERAVAFPSCTGTPGPAEAQGAASPWKGPSCRDGPGALVLCHGRDSPTTSTLSSRWCLVWLVAASRTRTWSWAKSRTSWLGKAQTCRVPPASRRCVETAHAVGTSLRNRRGPPAPWAWGQVEDPTALRVLGRATSYLLYQ